MTNQILKCNSATRIAISKILLNYSEIAQMVEHVLFNWRIIINASLKAQKKTFKIGRCRVQIQVREGFSLKEKKTIFRMNSRTGFEQPCWNMLMRYNLIIWLIKVPTEFGHLTRYPIGHIILVIWAKSRLPNRKQSIFAQFYSKFASFLRFSAF